MLIVILFWLVIGVGLCAAVVASVFLVLGFRELRKRPPPAAVLAIAVLSFAAIVAAAPAHADPPPPWADPHYPDKMHGNCAGGAGGAFGIGWCDGTHYPDGSYWHQIVFTGSLGGGAGGQKPQCVIDDGSLQPPPAPPGGCGGNA